MQILKNLLFTHTKTNKETRNLRLYDYSMYEDEPKETICLPTVYLKKLTL